MTSFRTTLWSRLGDAADGRPTALDEFVSAYRPALVRFLAKRGLSEADAEDVAHDVFVRLLSRDLLAQAEMTEEEEDRYADLLDDLLENGDDPPCHQLLGYPSEIQAAMELECQLASNGLDCGDESGYQDPRRDVLEAGAKDWRLLLQIDTDEEGPGWMWGDLGRLYFFGRREELERGDFEPAWLVLQCY